jgi:putative glutamine amidotransferase
MRPLIGISQCLDDRGRWRPRREYQYLDTAYARAVADAGATPTYLPLQADPEASIERVDGLVLPGGDDLVPQRTYPPGVHFDAVPERQLAFDRQLLAAARARGIPVLAICYGMQVLALHCGGSLHYDIPTDFPSAGAHDLPEDDGRHPIEVAKHTRLAAILGDAPDPVNSRHHQAVAEPGAGLRACAFAADGLIEAIESSGEDFALGVQWHPEKMDNPHRAHLFGAFVSACRKCAK